MPSTNPSRGRRLLSAALGFAMLCAPCLLSDLAGSARGAGTHRISGRIVCGLFGFGISDVKLYGLPGDPKTDSGGYYSATVPDGWSGAAYPLYTDLHFDPFGRNYVNVTTDLVHNYKTTLPVPSIWGYVKTPAGQPVECVVMSGIVGAPMTNSHGYYLTYVDRGDSGTVWPTKTGYTFDPTHRVYNNVTQNMGDEDYVAYGLPGITVTPAAGLVTTEAGGTAQFQVVLNTAPLANVVVGISSGDPTEGAPSLPSLTFTPTDWNVPQTVTIVGMNDDERDGDVAYTIITAPAVSGDANYQGVNAPDVSVTNRDDDTPGFAVTPTSGLTTTEAGGTAQFTVALLGRPTADVTIPLTSSDLTEGTVDPASLTFTIADWNTPQTVTVTGVDDLDADGDILYTIVLGQATSTDAGYNGLDPADVGVTNRNDDAPPLILVTPLKKTAFGNVEVGQSNEVDAFTVGNSGGARLTGSLALVSTDFAIISGGTFDLLGGQQQTVRIRFTPTLAKKRSAKAVFTSNGGIVKRSVEGVGTAHTVIVDNLDNDAVKRFEVVSGTWQTAAVQLKYWATDYRTTPTGDGSAVAAWTFRVPYTATYQVSAWWPKPLKTWGSAVPYRIFHARGQTVINARQNSGGGKWVSLGKFDFGPGTEWRVEMNNNSLGTEVAADAIRVMWVAPTALAKTAGAQLPPKPASIPLGIVATPPRGAAPLDVLLEAVGVPAGATCTWDFGDHTAGKGLEAIHTYYSPGTYTVILTAGGKTARTTVEVGN